jgi:hypothetical protein
MSIVDEKNGNCAKRNTSIGNEKTATMQNTSSVDEKTGKYAKSDACVDVNMKDAPGNQGTLDYFATVAVTSSNRVAFAKCAEESAAGWKGDICMRTHSKSIMDWLAAYDYIIGSESRPVYVNGKYVTALILTFLIPKLLQVPV